MNSNHQMNCNNHPEASLERSVKHKTDMPQTVKKSKSKQTELQRNDSNLALETIAKDMKSVLENVKKNLKNFQKDSYSDVVPTLEKMIENQMIRYEKFSETHDNDDGVEMYLRKSHIELENHQQQTNKKDNRNVRHQNSTKNNNNNAKPCAKGVPSANSSQISNSESGKSGQNNNTSYTKSTNVPSKIKSNSNSGKKSLFDSIRNTFKWQIKELPIDKTCSPIKNMYVDNTTSDNSSTPSTAKRLNFANDATSSQSSKNSSRPKTQEKVVTNKAKSSGNKGGPSTSSVNAVKKNISSSSGASSSKKSNVPKKPATKVVQNYSVGPLQQLVSSLASRYTSRSGAYPTNIDKNINNPLAQYKEIVNAAIRARKTFIIKGNYQAIRRALLRRGWIERIPISNRDWLNTEMRNFVHKSIVELLELIRQKSPSTELCKRLIKSKLLINHQVDLYWGYNYDGYNDCPDKVKLTLINKIRWTSAAYTSKQSLSEASKIAIWYHIPGIANLNHPRSYRLVKDGEAEEFVQDFNLTAAMSLLKWVKLTNETQQGRIMSNTGKVPIRIFDFAINECYKFIKRSTHQDIDHEIKEAMSPEWNEFLEYFYKTVHVGNHFKQEQNLTELDLIRRANFILEKLREHWPYVDMDGLMNIWILKPTNSSKGMGIHMCRTLNYVLDTVKANPSKRYIIQKYIERPRLIYNTKFDIRQWFLISSCCPLTIWIYKQCYLRFSSQTYNLRKLHESIHLTNNSVQCKYQNHSKDLNLPSFNMWDSLQFKNYLSDIGFPTVYNKIVYPGMKECITAAVLMHYEKMDNRKNCFELYGADFILSEDFSPWLLEINSNPALYGSTPITAKLCPMVLEDVIKVVVDYARDRKASTGGFEILYKGTEVTCQQKELTVSGKRINIEQYEHDELIKRKDSSLTTKVSKRSTQDPQKLGVGMKRTLEGLLELIQKEREKREEKLSRDVMSLKQESAIQTCEAEQQFVPATSAEMVMQS